jgi:tetratricopeptide (TPR) repeat protein
MARGALALALAAACAAPAQARALQQAPAAASVNERLARVAQSVFAGTEHLDENITELKAILAIDPQSAEAHMLLGIAYRGKDSADLLGEAAGELRQAVAINPSLVPARLYLAHLYLDLARPERAKTELTTALESAPDQPQLLALLGEAERQLGHPDTTIELTEKALAANAGYAEARYYHGLALGDLGQRDEAIQDFERVLADGGTRFEVYSSLGSAYVEAGRLDQAIDALTDAIKLDPSRPEPMIELARAFRLKGQTTRAEAPLKEVRAMVPDTAVSGAGQQVLRDLNYEEGLLRLQQRRLAAAARNLRKAVDLDPNYGPGRRALAEVLLRQGLYAEASDQALRASKLGSPLAPELQKTLDEKLRASRAKGRG